MDLRDEIALVRSNRRWRRAFWLATWIAAVQAAAIWALVSRVVSQ